MLLVDTDPQGSASYWTTTREEDDIKPRVPAFRSLARVYKERLRTSLTDTKTLSSTRVVATQSNCAPEWSWPIKSSCLFKHRSSISGR